MIEPTVSPSPKDYYEGLREGVGGFASSLLAALGEADPEAYTLVSEVLSWIGGTAQLILNNIDQEEKDGYPHGS